MIQLKGFLFAATILFSVHLKCQEVSGSVSDAYGPVPGVNVMVKGTTNGTHTDFDGNYVLNNVDANAVLLFRFIGYITTEIAVNGQSTINVSFEEDPKALDELVVVGYETNSGNGKSDLSDVPQFPWPPPSPSAKTEIPSIAFATCKTIGNVNDILNNALSKFGYVDKGYFLVPATYKNGFALATQLEQIDKFGFSKEDPNRWTDKPITHDFSFGEYIRALFFSNPGYFRVIVFIVTDKPFSANNTPVDRKTALDWIKDGFSSFPKELRNVPYSDEHTITALIYEYELHENSDQANLVNRFNAKEHLVKANLWSAINKE